MWFDDLYKPDWDLFLEAFSLQERERLARFTRSMMRGTSSCGHVGGDAPEQSVVGSHG
jgi:hypothetical protein